MSIKEKAEGEKGYSDKLFGLRKQRFDLQNGVDTRASNAVDKLGRAGIFEIVEELIEIVPESEAALSAEENCLLLEYKGEFVNLRWKRWFVFSFSLPFDKDELSLTVKRDSLLMLRTRDLYFPERAIAKTPLSISDETTKDRIEFEVVDALLKVGFPFKRFDFSGFSIEGGVHQVLEGE